MGGGGAASGCPCSTDQDCAVPAGKLLLCAEGACQEGDPAGVPSPLGRCDADRSASDDAGRASAGNAAVCRAGSACGVMGECHPAPRCQRLELTELSVAHVAGLATGVVAAVRDDCVHTWIFPDGLLTAALRFQVALDGTFVFQDESAAGCGAGVWRAGQRAGLLVCDTQLGTQRFVVTPASVSSTVCFGQGCSDACTLLAPASTLDERVGVCP